MKRYHLLDFLREKILAFRGKEPAGNGEYASCHDSGLYLCYQCDSPLYLSSSKFDSGSGWPSFDEEIPGAVKRLQDLDGQRVEIRCANCGGHLGHVFLNEGFTKRMIRHCVNSAALRFMPAYTEEGYEHAYFAGGCFWGLEYYLRNQKGVKMTQVGYIGGNVVNPTYQEVSSSCTGHAEVVHVCFDPKEITFEELAKIFFECHDPYDEGGKGPDRGVQYRSAIFCMSEAQLQIAGALKNQLETENQHLTTNSAFARVFYPAQEYHQHYYEKTKSLPYCHKWVQRFNRELEKTV
jgi:peptide methionine sulfoxide reductase msrA/msrB